MLTTERNAEVRSVGHHRMPVLLTSREQYARWLDPEIVELIVAPGFTTTRCCCRNGWPPIRYAPLSVLAFRVQGLM
jgi:hypothetical protein